MLVSSLCNGRPVKATFPKEVEHPLGMLLSIKRNKKEHDYRVNWSCGCVWSVKPEHAIELRIWLMNKKITDMSDEEISAEIERLQQIPIPSPPQGKRPKRLDQQPKKRKSLFDIVSES